MEGHIAWNKIIQSAQDGYCIDGHDAGYMGNNPDILSKRIYPDTSTYLFILGDCPKHYKEGRHNCVRVKIRLSDHSPSFENTSGFLLWYGEDERNEPVMVEAIKAILALPPYNQKKAHRREVAAHKAKITRLAKAVLATEWESSEFDVEGYVFDLLEEMDKTDVEKEAFFKSLYEGDKKSLAVAAAMNNYVCCTCESEDCDCDEVVQMVSEIDEVHGDTLVDNINFIFDRGIPQLGEPHHPARIK